MFYFITLSLCLSFSNQAGDVMVQRQLGVTEQVLEQLAPAEVVEDAFIYPMHELGTEQERVIDEFREKWMEICLEEEENDD